MAAARPMVTTRFAGVEDFIDPGVNAHVVALDDDAAAFERLRSLLENPTAAAALGAAARRTVEDRFGMELMVEATLLYHETIMRAQT